MINYEALNDYNLVAKCKKKGAYQKKALTTLYMRYLPLINKKYTKFKKIFTSISMEREDYQSEAYFEMLKAVDYVNFEKITKPDTWKFLGVFIWYLDAFSWETVRVFNNKEVKDTSLTVANDEGEEVSVTDLVPDLCEESSETVAVNAYYEKEALSKFYASLTDFETKVLKKRIDVREHGKPRQLTEIAAEMKTNYSRIQETCKSIECKFKQALVY